MNKSIFFPAKNERLAKIISITSPKAFAQSIRKLKQGGLTLTEKRALVLARTRATLMLRRKDLSMRERRQMLAIANMKIPKITRR